MNKINSSKLSGNHITALITAAGKGLRMGRKTNKQFLHIGGQPVLAWTIRAFQRVEWISEIVIVAPENRLDYVKEEIVQQYGFSRVKRIVPGGRERQDSVFAGLQALQASAEWVFIHDGVRPFIQPDLLEQVYYVARRSGAAVVGYPSRDTVKRAREGRILHTEDRREIWLVQTPQVFQFSLIYQAYLHAQKEKFYGTDDAALVERMGKEVSVVEGDYYNIKITTPEDLRIAEFLLSHYFPVNGEPD